jgi:hypothetical protein
MPATQRPRHDQQHDENIEQLPSVQPALVSDPAERREYR